MNIILLLFCGNKEGEFILALYFVVILTFLKFKWSTLVRDITIQIQIFWSYIGGIFLLGPCDRMVVGFTTTCAISAYHH